MVSPLQPTPSFPSAAGCTALLGPLAPPLPLPLPRRDRVRAAAGAKSPFPTPNARIVLADGTEMEGFAFGRAGTVVGEVVFNTSMSGYQEIMTDPSYAGQFVCFTHPHVGNTGINSEDMESSICHMKGMIVRDVPSVHSNYRSEQSLDQFCKSQVREARVRVRVRVREERRKR